METFPEIGIIGSTRWISRRVDFGRIIQQCCWTLPFPASGATTGFFTISPDHVCRGEFLD